MYFIVMKSMYISSIILLINLQLFASSQIAGSFTMTRIQYSGGGDWYADQAQFLTYLILFLTIQIYLLIKLKTEQKLDLIIFSIAIIYI